MPSTFKTTPLTCPTMSALVEWPSPICLHSLRNTATLSTRSMPRSMEGTDDQFIAGSPVLVGRLLKCLSFFSFDVWKLLTEKYCLLNCMEALSTI
nr:hypothetical protein CFP56_75027 [Quercus suber]